MEKVQSIDWEYYEKKNELEIEISDLEFKLAKLNRWKAGRKTREIVLISIPSVYIFVQLIKIIDGYLYVDIIHLPTKIQIVLLGASMLCVFHNALMLCVENSNIDGMKKIAILLHTHNYPSEKETIRDKIRTKRKEIVQINDEFTGKNMRYLLKKNNEENTIVYDDMIRVKGQT